MGWWNAWQRVKGWGSVVWNSPGAAKIVRGTTQFSYNTIVKIFGQIGAVPETLYSWSTEPAARKVASHIALATVDVAFIAVASGINQFVQDKGKEYLDENPDEAWLSVNAALIFILFAANSSTLVINRMRSLQFLLRMGVILIESPPVLNAAAAKLKIKGLPVTYEASHQAEDAGTEPMPAMDCVCDHCSVLRKTQGSVRGLVTYYATEYAISYLEYLPLMGPLAAYGFSTYHNGRYILSLKVGQVLCDRHTNAYLNAYPSLAMSYGLLHGIVAACTIGMGVPVNKAELQQLLLPFFVSIAAHMPAPAAPEENKTKGFDPLGAYVWLTGTLFDIFCLGSKKWLDTQRGKAFRQELAQWLRANEEPVFDLQLLKKGALGIWDHPLTRGIKGIGFPMLSSQQALINDPVIQPNFDELRAKFIAATKMIQDANEAIPSPLLNIATQYQTPRLAFAMLLKAAFGIKPSLGELLLKAFGSQAVISAIADSRRRMEAIMTGKAPPAPVNAQALPIRTSEEECSKKTEEPVAPDKDEIIQDFPAAVGDEGNKLRELPAAEKIYGLRYRGVMFAQIHPAEQHPEINDEDYSDEDDNAISPLPSGSFDEKYRVNAPY